MALTGKPQLTSNAQIGNDGFWPMLVIGDLVAKYRIPAEYDDGVISWGLQLGMIRVNQQLSAAKLACLYPEVTDTSIAPLQVYTALVDFAAAHTQLIDGEETLVTFYKHACYSMAKAFLLQQFNTMNRRTMAENVKKESYETEDYWLNQAQWAINSILKAIVPGIETVSDFGVHVALI
jgi:hypothetical protein